MIERALVFSVLNMRMHAYETLSAGTQIVWTICIKRKLSLIIALYWTFIENLRHSIRIYSFSIAKNLFGFGPLVQSAPCCKAFILILVRVWTNQKKVLSAQERLWSLGKYLWDLRPNLSSQKRHNWAHSNLRARLNWTMSREYYSLGYSCCIDGWLFLIQCSTCDKARVVASECA